MTQPAYCTILARNYLSRALVLAESLRRHESDKPLVVFLIDVTDESELPVIPGVRWMTPASLDLPQRALHELAASYDLVEFATAVKPLVLKALLREHEQVVYLDPDTYATAPLADLAPALEASPGGIVLTPHTLLPNLDRTQFSEGHLLVVGVYNLGFCAVDRRAEAFLDWWWGHLREECLLGLLDGLFTDQKWVDVGAVLFDASALRHYGYNVSIGNLHERPVEATDDGYVIAGTGDPLRLFHFHAFDPRRPDNLYGRANTTAQDASTSGTAAVGELARIYAAELLEAEARIGRQPDYIYGADTTGRRISRRMRHAYRTAALAAPGTLPSPFVAAEAQAYEQWRRGARGLAGRLILSDLAKGARSALPEEYDRFRRRFPRVARTLRGRYVQDTGMWG